MKKEILSENFWEGQLSDLAIQLSNWIKINVEDIDFKDENNKELINIENIVYNDYRDEGQEIIVYYTKIPNFYLERVCKIGY